MTKRFQRLSALAIAAFALGAPAAKAQAPYNTISGIVWNDGLSSNGIRAAGEPRIGGVLAMLVRDSDDSLVSVGMSNDTGYFSIPNYLGAGTYRVSYAYPDKGYSVSAKRVGADLLGNSAADPGSLFNSANLVSSDPFTISSAADVADMGLGLVPIATRIVQWRTQKDSAADWTKVFLLPKADTTLSTLAGVHQFVTIAARHPNIGFENTSSATPAELDYGGKAKIFPHSLTTGSFEAKSSVVRNLLLPAYDSTIDYAGTSGVMFNNDFGGNYTEFTATAAQRGAYRGGPASTFKDSVVTTGSTTIGGGGNLVSSVSTSAAVGLFVIYTYSTPVLSANLLSFRAAKAGSTAMLNWETAADETTRGFAVERSADGVSFTEIGFVSAPSSKRATQSFSHTDGQPLAGYNHYRLKQTDESGHTLYSAVQSVSFDSRAALRIFPNPADAAIYVQTGERGRAMLYSPLGQLVQSVEVEAGAAAVLQTAALLPGLYTVQVVTDGGVRTERVLIAH